QGRFELSSSAYASAVASDVESVAEPGAGGGDSQVVGERSGEKVSVGRGAFGGAGVSWAAGQRSVGWFAVSRPRFHRGLARMLRCARVSPGFAVRAFGDWVVCNVGVIGEFGWCATIPGPEASLRGLGV